MPNYYTEPHRSESTTLSTQPNPHLRASSKIVQFLIRVYCSQINQPCLRIQKLQCRLTAPYIIVWFVACEGDLQRKKINADDHLSMCNCSGGTGLDKLGIRISRSACTFSRVEQTRGYVDLPRENEHHDAHFRGWCSNSRANLCAAASRRGTITLLLLLFAGTVFCEFLRFGKIAKLSTRKYFYQHIRHSGVLVHTIKHCVMFSILKHAFARSFSFDGFFQCHIFSSFPCRHELEKVTFDDFDDRGSFTSKT